MHALESPKRAPSTPGMITGLAFFCLAVLATDLGLWVGPLLAAAAWMLRAPRWWLAMIALAPPLRWAVGSLGLSDAAFLGGLGLLLAVFGLHFISRVPVYPSRQSSVDLAAQLLPHRRYQEVLDLGAGTGSAMRRFQAHSSLWHVHGVEQALGPWLIGWLHAQGSNRGYEVRLGRFESISWASADLVYAYLSPAAIPAVVERAASELKEGAYLVSNEFQVDERPGTPLAQTDAQDIQEAQIFVWRKVGGQLQPMAARNAEPAHRHQGVHA